MIVQGGSINKLNDLFFIFDVYYSWQHYVINVIRCKL